MVTTKSTSATRILDRGSTLGARLYYEVNRFLRQVVDLEVVPGA